MASQLEPYFTRRNCLAALALAFALLLALYSHAFRAGYYGEDFAWLVWSRESSFLDVWLAPGGTYFRPLSVRLPYWLFPRLPAGILLWKLTAFSLIGGTAVFFWRWLEELGVKRGLALFLAVLWLHSPFQCFPLFYVNAFDYVLFPFCLVGFLFFAEKKEWGRGLVFFWLALLANEWALAFPLLVLLRSERPGGRMLWAYLVSPVVFMVWSKFFVGGGFAGFSPGFVAQRVGEALVFFSSRTFSPGFVEQPFFAWFWFAAAGLVWLAAVLSYLLDLSKLSPGTVPRLLFAVCILFTPFFFLSNLQSEFLGGVLWLFLLAIAGIGISALSVKRRNGILILAAIGLLAFLPSERLELHKRFASYARVFDFTLSRAQLFAGQCDPGVQVAWGGMEKLVKTQEESEHAIWGMRWKFPGRDFFLIKDPASFNEAKVLLSHKQFWVDRAATADMLVLETMKTGKGTEVFSPTRGTPGCGLPGGKDTIGI